jgi:hypothetical protein
MDGCAHGMEPAWRYLYRIEASGAAGKMQA